MEIPAVYLIIREGEPHLNDSKLVINEAEIILGRPGQTNYPDIIFTNPLISRKHAMIKYQDSAFFIIDLASKHGTRLNGIEIEPNRAFSLNDGDSIVLAQGAARLEYIDLSDSDIDVTVDLGSYVRSSITTSSKPLLIDFARREVRLEGKPLHLSGKDLDLLLFLYKNRNNAVSYDQIRLAIWAERSGNSSDNIPDVGSDEITALIYRLRKRLGEQGSLIITIPRFGYRLDI